MLPYGANFGYISKDNRSVLVTNPIPKILTGDYIRDGRIEYRKVKVHGRLMTSDIKMGLTKKNKPMWKFVPYDRTYPYFIVAANRKRSARDLYACVEYNGDWYDEYHPKGVIVNIIGKIGDPTAEREFLISRYGLKRKKSIISTDHHDIYKREFLHEKIYSIDPIGCRDIDDALHAKETPDGYEVGVHIADVSSYISPDSPLDLLGKERVESLYLDGTQNMYPDKLVEKMSLLAGKDKRSFSIIMNISRDGKITSHRLKRYTIRVTNLSYDDAAALIDKNNDITLLYNIGKKLYDGTNASYDVHKMVEVFMIRCNTIAAKMMGERGIFRSFRGVNKTGVDAIDIYRSDRSVYTSYNDNKGHSIIGENMYTHFTSPIRRYVDVLVHRILSDTDCDYDLKHINKVSRLIRRAGLDMRIIDWITALDNNNISTTGIVVDNYRDCIIYVDEYKVYTKIRKGHIDKMPAVGDRINIILSISLFNYRINEKVMCQLGPPDPPHTPTT